MCKDINGKTLTLQQILDRLEQKKNMLAHTKSFVPIVYSKQEIESAKVVLDRLVARTNASVPHEGTIDAITTVPENLYL